MKYPLLSYLPKHQPKSRPYSVLNAYQNLYGVLTMEPDGILSLLERRWRPRMTIL